MAGAEILLDIHGAGTEDERVAAESWAPDLGLLALGGKEGARGGVPPGGVPPVEALERKERRCCA